MNNAPRDQLQFIAACPAAVFSALREKLAIEVSSSALLAELLEKVSQMQQAQATPAEFKRRFLAFVNRAEEHMEIVQPFFPALIIFLPPLQYPVKTPEEVSQQLREV